MTSEEIERRSAAHYKAPRVSREDILDNIVHVAYATGREIARVSNGLSNHPESLDVLTICIVTVRNGFTVVGKSAPASPENFDPAYGRELAYDDAIKQLWPLMGYALREQFIKESTNG